MFFCKASVVKNQFEFEVKTPVIQRCKCQALRFHDINHGPQNFCAGCGGAFCEEVHKLTSLNGEFRTMGFTLTSLHVGYKSDFRYVIPHCFKVCNCPKPTKTKS